MFYTTQNLHHPFNQGWTDEPRHYRARYAHPAIAKQPVSQLWQIPWGHNIVIISKSQSYDEASYYVAKTQKHG